MLKEVPAGRTTKKGGFFEDLRGYPRMISSVIELPDRRPRLRGRQDQVCVAAIHDRGSVKEGHVDRRGHGPRPTRSDIKPEPRKWVMNPKKRL